MFNAILINPWVYDFTYYNLWEKPVGLLKIAAGLKALGIKQLHYIDCVDEKLKKKSEYEKGSGKITGSIVSKPLCFESVPRYYNKFGISREQFIVRLKNASELCDKNQPIVILITCMMTYWYSGAFETAELVRQLLPDAKIILGGIYARLLPDHAKKSGLFDFIETSGEVSTILKDIFQAANADLAEELKKRFSMIDFDDLMPAYELMAELNNSAALLTSSGCPYNCTYCASNKLYPLYKKRNTDSIVRDILYYKNTLQVENIAFYDDALLYKKEEHFYRLAAEFLKTGIEINFHLPNAVHAALIDEYCACLMKKMGFKTIRLGYEFYEGTEQKSSGGKVTNQSLINAVRNLLNAGFTQKEIGVYILLGHPLTDISQIKSAVDFVIDCGATPNLSLYSPIPGTPDGERIFEKKPEFYNEPLMQNKTCFFELYGSIKLDEYYSIKKYIGDKLTKKISEKNL